MSSKSDELDGKSATRSYNSFDAVMGIESSFSNDDITKVVELLTFRSNRLIRITSENEDHNAIYRAIKIAMGAAWYDELKLETQVAYQWRLNDFIKWMNVTDHTRTSLNRYECLNDYAAYQINERKTKRTSVSFIKNFIRRGCDNQDLSRRDFLYLHNLVKVSKKDLKTPAEGYTLTDWFSLPWLRDALGDKKYLQLESPSRLLLSFRVTVATTLLYLLECRSLWFQKIHTAPIKRDCTKWHYHWAFNLMSQVAKFDEDANAADALSNCLYLDLISRSKYQYFNQFIPRLSACTPNGLFTCWISPSVFDENYHHNYSVVEEKLAAWLMACEAIQPTDIGKLKTSDYAMEFSNEGRLLFMQCTYYKGRAATFMHPKILMASDCWTKAIHEYIKGIENGGMLFRSNIHAASVITNIEAQMGKGPFDFLYKLWSSAHFKEILLPALARAKASSIFVDAILCLGNGSPTYSSLSTRSKITRKEYELSFPRPLPTTLFRLTHIKTTAVHAGSDMYRESDLINHHSHSSKTEKHSYLTDKNKDWVNRCGRITRMVLHDLQKFVYQPSLERIINKVSDYEQKTTISSEEVKISSSSQQTSDMYLSNYDEYEEIIVTDNTDTALYFMHYLTEAEAHIDQLLQSRPDFVEHTLIPRVEWMTRTLNRMASASAANDQYQKLAKYFPPMFSHLMETMACAL